MRTIALASLLSLLAGCASAPPRPSGDAWDRCRTRSPAACAELGHERVLANRPDDRWTAALLMAACEGGVAKACAELAAFPLQASAEDASERYGLEEARQHADDVRAFVPRELEPTLAITPERIAAAGRLDPRYAQVVAFLSQQRLSRLRCGRPTVWLTFALDSLGSARDVTVALLGQGDAACVRSAVEGWTFPLPYADRGGFFWVGASQTGRPEDLVASPGEAGKGWTAPVSDPACIASSVKVPASMSGVHGKVRFKFAVDRDGKVSLFHPIDVAPPVLVHAVREAVEGCAWLPGHAPDGTTARIWVVLPMRFQQGSR